MKKTNDECEKEILKLIKYYNKYTQEFDLMLDEMGFTEHLLEKVKEQIDKAKKEVIEEVKEKGLFISDYDMLKSGINIRLVKDELLADYIYEEWSKERDGMFDNKTPQEARKWILNAIKTGFFKHNSVGIQKIGAMCYQRALTKLKEQYENK